MGKGVAVAQGTEALTRVLQGASHRSTGKTLQATYWGANGTRWRLRTTRYSAGSCPLAAAIGAKRRAQEPEKKALSLTAALQRPLLTNLKWHQLVKG